MATIQTVPRVFKIGPSLLEDPDPELSPEDALKLYTPSHPALAHCTLAEPRLEGDRLVYEVVRPTATTKGKSGGLSPADAIEAEISVWENEQAGGVEALADPRVIESSLSLLQSIDRRGQTNHSESINADAAAIDSLLIPMC